MSLYRNTASCYITRIVLTGRSDALKSLERFRVPSLSYTDPLPPACDLKTKKCDSPVVVPTSIHRPRSPENLLRIQDDRDPRLVGSLPRVLLLK